MEADVSKAREPDPISYLQTAYERTLDATAPNDCQGTTTASGAQLYFKKESLTGDTTVTPLLYVTNLGDCQILVLRPSDRTVVYKTKEQWHWFDCPRQLGTNSPDTPRDEAVMDTVEIQVGDIVLAMSDGVIDNLWEHEIVDTVANGLQLWEQASHRDTGEYDDSHEGQDGGMRFVAEALMTAAKTIALDPFAESPYMERAIEEGLSSEGGKLDDISVVAARCV